MKNPNFLFQILPILTIILCVFAFVIYKILSRIKHQAQGNPNGGRLAEFKLATPEPMPVIERLKIECPAIVERPQGLTKVGIKEISINGAFATCPKPFPVGATFPIKIIIERGEFRPDVKPASVAAALVGTWDALFLQAWFEDSFDPKNIARDFLKIVIKGLSKND